MVPRIFSRLGRRKDEPQMSQGLFDQFQQRVSSVLGQLMGFVDDVDRVARS